GTSTQSQIPLYDDPDWAKGYDLVIHNECFADAKDPNWVHRVLLPHRQGVPACVVHCAMHCYRLGNDDWFQFCGVTSRRHGAGYPHEVLNRDPLHPAMAGFGAAWANPAGELYWIEKLWPTAKPLASAKNRETGKEEVCVWANEYGKTRVFGTTLGHHNETVGDPKFLDLLTRGVLWATNKSPDEYLKPRLPEYVPIDLALNKPATASSEETAKNNFAKLANDGDPSTRWCAGGAGTPQWWQVDLGKAHKVEGCKLTWEGGGPYRYKIEGSADAQTWHELVDASKNEKGGPYTHLFSADGVRYFRVTCLNVKSGGWASLFDVSVFGDEKKLVEPGVAVNLKEAGLLDEVKIPEGFEKTLFAAPPAVIYPVFVSASVDGTVYVSVDKNGSLDRKPHHGAIYRLRDVDGDGRADESKLFVSDVDSPRGIVADGNTVYCLHPPHVSAFIDHDGDGISDEQKILVKNIAFTFKDRPADHTSNGVTLGIDGWLYFAIGDFGFMEAEGTDGKKLQLRAGGVVRCRPDGTGLELYTRGTRNILEVGVDPLLNAFARDNTNDGGGWDVRLHHFSGLEEHGYPSFYKNFSDDMVQPLADYGGGSGCGACYIDEPGFPKGYGNALYTADWGRNFVYKHNPTPAGATFTADQTEFVGATRVTDLDVDGDSNVYVASWKGATFTYAGEDVGYLVRVRPKGYQPEPLPDFAKATDAELVKVLESPSHRRRLESQRTLVKRGLSAEATKLLATLAGDASKSLPSRVAALYALELGGGKASLATLLTLAKDPSIREYAIRALGDLGDNSSEAIAAVAAGVSDENPRVRRTAAWSLARIGSANDGAALTPLLADVDPVVAHTAWKALVALKASDAAFAVVNNSGASLVARANAIRALESLHDAAVVETLIALLAKEADAAKKLDLFTALCRLNFREGPWKGDSWGTRPDTSGPYYQPEKWEASTAIASALKTTLDAAPGGQAAKMLAEMQRHKVQLEGGLDDLVVRAEKDPALVPPLVDQLAKAQTIPSAALPILRKAATEAGSKPELRASAIIALSKNGDEGNVGPLLDGIVKLEASNPPAELLTSARESLFSGAALLAAADKLNAAAEAGDGKSALWAEAA
ncbi:MAG TPA: discoidin domain-containing protein, partial [Pirellulales bacterium]